MLGVTTILLLLAATVRGATDFQTQATKEVLGKLGRIDPDVRPSVGDAPTIVKVQTYIRNMDVDDVNMRILLDITYRMHWVDPRLAFDKEYRDVEHVVVMNPSLSWLPDAFFKDAMTTQYESVHPECYLRVYPDGNLTYSARFNVNLNCPMNLKRFPHDSQQCDMQIASYGYTRKDLIFMWKEISPTEISTRLHGGRFSLEKFDTDYCDSKTSTGEYSCVEVNIVVRRYFGAYVLEWYLPTIFLIVVAWFSFFIPFEQFLGRLILTIIPLIGLASFSHTFTHGLASVPYVRALDIFTGFSLCVIFLTLVHIVVCYIRGIKSNTPDGEAGKSDSVEEGGKSVDEEMSGFRRFLQKVTSNVEFLSRSLLVGFYIAFLFVYFAAYCGTG